MHIYVIIVWLKLKVEGAHRATEGVCREECKLFCLHTSLEISVFIFTAHVCDTCCHLLASSTESETDVSLVDFLHCNSLHARQELADGSGICCCVPFYIV